MSRSLTGSRWGWSSLFLSLLAVAALAVPGVGYLTASRADGQPLGDSPRQLRLPADRTYGIYVTDADNSGYSVGCEASDIDGPVDFRRPSWSVSGSDIEMLDLVYDTGTGRLTISCSSDETIETRPVPNHVAMLIGLLVAGTLGCVAVGCAIAWLVARGERQATTLPRSTTRDGSASTDRSSTGLRG
ncbi:hypothetical protein RB608_02280 [Nocardioides sp. LHD-245]|uniref:hypothetical protein n=1 Tax=Nocardioides sp. LHD-245 TaxID=3051387 RepID=UPI0027E0CA73|nr:hypothetical protein [Nocardioides sp. LHD-245]